MLNVARLGDLTIGICHHKDHIPFEVLGNIVSSSEDSFSEGSQRGIARVGDLVLTRCGHFGKIVTGSPTVFLGENLRNVARLGDLVDGDYTAHIITSSEDIFVDE